MSDEPINFLGNLRRIEVKPGDTFVITVEQQLSLEMVKRIREEWNKFFNDDRIKVMILGDGVNLGVISVVSDDKDPQRLNG